MSRRRAAVVLLAVLATLAPAGAAAHGAAAAPTTAAATVAAAAAVGNPKVPGHDPRCCGRTFLRPGERIASSPQDDVTLYGEGLDGITLQTGYRLSLQSDGNLVERQDTQTGTRVVWSSGTAGTATLSAPAVLTFQTDGNVVLRARDGRAVWASGTAGRPARYFDVYGNGQVVTQDAAGRVLAAAGPAEVALPGIAVTRLTAPGAFTSNAPFHEVVVQADGNVVEYATDGSTRRAVWSTRTAGAGQVRLVAQSDGNLVVRQFGTGRAVWASGSRGPAGYYQLDMQDDDNLVLYRTDGTRRLQAVWATGIRA